MRSSGKLDLKCRCNSEGEGGGWEVTFLLH